MSAAAVKLSPAIKALIAAPHALGSALPAPSRPACVALFDRVRANAAGRIGSDTFLTTATAALVTVNSPATVCELWRYAAGGAGAGAGEGKGEGEGATLQEQVGAAAVIRETALKCISFSGIPRTINALNALRAELPPAVVSGLSTSPTRLPSPSNIESISTRGRALWDAIYEPHAAKLLAKLGDAHPDLPVHILHSHYGPLLSDPELESHPGLNSNSGPSDPFGARSFGAPAGKVGRVLTSVVAMACLRAQQGVAPQLTSHVFGLKKALLEGGGAEGEAPVQGQEWLTSDEGVAWVLESTDAISQVVGEGRTTFAGPMAKAKL